MRHMISSVWACNCLEFVELPALFTSVKGLPKVIPTSIRRNLFNAPPNLSVWVRAAGTMGTCAMIARYAAPVFPSCSACKSRLRVPSGATPSTAPSRKTRRAAFIVAGVIAPRLTQITSTDSRIQRVNKWRRQVSPAKVTTRCPLIIVKASGKSNALRWLLAKINPPETGKFSSPDTRTRATRPKRVAKMRRKSSTPLGDNLPFMKTD